MTKKSTSKVGKSVNQIATLLILNDNDRSSHETKIAISSFLEASFKNLMMMMIFFLQSLAKAKQDRDREKALKEDNLESKGDLISFPCQNTPLGIDM